jgi:Fungal Zn(2)-Cys(6) binuclear cluster domain
MSQYGHAAAPVAPPPPPTSSVRLSPTASSTTSVPASSSGLPLHKRVYQACIPCRRRKVRCDLGSVDNPHDPPCVRCRRESKECFFSATRRKRKTEDGEGSEDGEIDEYIIRNGRKRLHASGSPPPPLDHRMYSEVPLTPGGSAGRREPLRRPDAPRSVGSSGSQTGSRRAEFGVGEEPSATLNNPEAQNVMRRGVYGPHDALDLLYKAATDNHKREEHDPAAASLSQQSLLHAGTAPPRKQSGLRFADPRRGDIKLEQPIDPELSRPRDIANEPGYAEALRAWTRFRFVRAGWFTAQEAIEYID